MGIADTRKIDGRIVYFDERGNECDNLGRPFLRQSPETKAKLAQMKAEAIERSKRNVFLTREQREDNSRKTEIKERIAGLREAIHHVKCQQEFYHNLNKPDVLSLWLADLDKNIEEMIRYRNHLLKKHCIADEMIGELASVMLHHDHEITSLQDELEEIEAKHKEPKQKVERDTNEIKKNRLIKAIGIEKVQEFERLNLLDKVLASL